MRRCLVRVFARWCIPCRRQIVGELEEPCTIDLRTGRRYGGHLLDPPLKRGHAIQRVIPACLQLASDVAFLRVHQFVSTSGQRCFVAGRFKFPLDGSDDVFLRALDLVRGKDCGFNCAMGDGLQHLQSNRAIDPHASDADAQSHEHHRRGH